MPASGGSSFSALQRAEIAEIHVRNRQLHEGDRFSALQRAEIAEISRVRSVAGHAARRVSVLFNEPKLLKYTPSHTPSARQAPFQCSSTSRNC